MARRTAVSWIWRVPTVPERTTCPAFHAVAMRYGAVTGWALSACATMASGRIAACAAGVAGDAAGASGWARADWTRTRHAAPQPESDSDRDRRRPEVRGRAMEEDSQWDRAGGSET